MRPLDDAVAIVSEEKEKTQEKIQTTENRIKDAIEDRESWVNDIEQSEGKKTDLIDAKRGLHDEMDFFKDNHPEELEQFYQDDKNRKEIEALVKERTRLKKHVWKDDDARKQVRDEITKVHNELEISKSEWTNLEDNLKS